MFTKQTLAWHVLNRGMQANVIGLVSSLHFVTMLALLQACITYCRLGQNLLILGSLIKLRVIGQTANAMQAKKNFTVSGNK
jgi:hypothetical protein